MRKSKPPYPPELRRRLVALVASGRSPESLAEEYEPSARAIRNWVRQAERDGGLGSDERRQLKVLERENRELRRANEILRKASAYFAQAELDRRPK